MSLNDEQADILGGPLLQKPQSGLLAIFSRVQVTFKGGAVLVICFLAWVAFIRLREYVRRNRDLNYRKAMRRKHGIPDTDCRPFAVAYAAANRARADREARERNKLAGHVPSASGHHKPGGEQPRNAPVDAPHGQPHQLRRRLPESVDPRGAVPLSDYQRTGKRGPLQESKRPEADPFTFAERYHPNSRYSREEPEFIRESVSPIKRPGARRFSRKHLRTNGDATEESRKRSFAAESDDEPDNIKKSRIDGEELIDGDEEADWYAQYGDPRSDRNPVASSPNDRAYTNGHFNHEVDEQADEMMEDVDDEIVELPSIPRGKKRDRAEAGSTFGADDEEDVQNEKSTRHRKRRSVSKRKGEGLMRGKKRDRELESPESDGEGDVAQGSKRVSQRTSRKKRGKGTTSDEAGSDASVDDSTVSKDPLCDGRKIGEEWETDGVRYKVGDKGERLRLTLVKKARNKYHMPKDSHHPDRAAALEIYVETWMNEEQYKQAEGQHELVWQDLPSTEGSRTPEVSESPTKSGKDLLWDAVPGSPVSRRPFRQSLTANTTIRVNPFQQVQQQPNLGRRVASPSASVSPRLGGLTDSPTRSVFRGFSKWEKQDREAEAMAKIRAKMQEQKAQSEPVKASQPPTSTASDTSAKTLTVPTITLTPASPSPVEFKQASTEIKATPSFSFTPPPATSTESKTAPASITTPTTTPGFSFPSTSAPTTAPPAPPTSTSHPAPSAPATTVSSAPLFSFPPLTQPSPSATSATSTSTTASSSVPSIPNFFAKPAPSTASSAIPSSTTASPFTFAAPSQTQPSGGSASQTTEAPKVPTFSFAKPSTPAVPATTTTPQTTSVGSNAPIPASVFGVTPAKTDATAPSTNAPSESKSSAPPFVFTATPSSTTGSATQAAQAAPPPKFSFGPSSTGSAFSAAASSNAADNKLKFTFGPPTTAASGGPSSASATSTSEAKKETAPASIFAATGTKDTTSKVSSFGAPTSAFSGGSLFGAPPSINTTGKQADAPTSTTGGDASASSESSSIPKPASAFGTPTNVFPSASAGSLATGSTAPASNTLLFGNPALSSSSKIASSFGNTGFGTSGPTSTFSFAKKDDNTASTSTAAANNAGASSKPTFSFGLSNSTSSPFTTAASGENSTSSSSSTAPKPTLPFGASSGITTFPFGHPVHSGTKDASSTSGSDAAPKPTFSFSTPSNTASTNNATSNTSSSTPSKPMFSFAPLANTTAPVFGQPSSSGTSETANSTSSTTGGEAPKHAFSFGGGSNTIPAFGQPSPSSTSAASTDAALKPAFTFGGSSGGPASVFGQPSSSGASGTTGTDSASQAQSPFGKPSGMTPSAFGFGNTSGSTGSAFTFNKPPSQNQKQEQ
ncbi:hypothetical protein ID866_6163 [Astraeus odoratus]|nr:hypothetical protein ID866_6163 [Astraeus odoratus]